MKKYFLLIFLAPAFVNGQVKKQKSKTVTKTTTSKSVAVSDIKTASTEIKAADGYLIKGFIDGIADGTILKMLNGNSGAEEATTTVQKGKFSFSGKTTSPDFKVIGVNGQAPFITIFLDNSDVFVNAKKDAFETADIKGSASHNDFAAFTCGNKLSAENFSTKCAISATASEVCDIKSWQSAYFELLHSKTALAYVDSAPSHESRFSNPANSRLQ